MKICIDSSGRTENVYKKNVVALSNDEIRICFCFMNRAILTQHLWKNSSEKDFKWYPFQIAFILMCLPGIVNEYHNDRRICDVIIRAYELGAKFDGWSEHFKFDIWKQAMEDCGVDGEFYAYRERSYDEVLPWDFIDIGVTKQFLIDENEKAKAALTSPDCREVCLGCGVNTSFGEGACFENALLD